MEPTKRKYTVSEKVLAACRRNLVKANAVDKAIRYRPTAKRLKACRANLLKAQRVLKAAGERSPAYGWTFRLGLDCISLRRSLRLAGESREEFDAHLKKFDMAFAPQDAVEKRLVRGIAETAWRRLRALRGQARWEAVSVIHWLACAAAGWQPEGRRDGRIAPGQGMTEGETGERFAGARLDRDENLAVDMLGIASTDGRLFEALRKLNHRLESLCRLWVGKQCGEDVDFQGFTRPRHGSPALIAPRGQNAVDAPPAAAVLSNPFLSPSRMARALEKRAPKVRDIDGWYWQREKGLRWVADSFWNALPQSVREWRIGLMRRWAEASEKPGAGGEGLGDGLENFETFLELFELAFGMEADAGDRGMPREGTLATGTEVRNEGVENLDRRRLDSATRDYLRAAAAAAWERLGVYRRQAAQEAADLELVLEVAAQARAGGPRGRREWVRATPEKAHGWESTNRGYPSTELAQGDNLSGGWSENWAHELAAKVLDVFAGSLAATEAAYDAYERLKGALKELLEYCYGSQPRSEIFEPEDMSELGDDESGRALEALSLLAIGAHVEAGEWKEQVAESSSASDSAVLGLGTAAKPQSF